MPSVLSLLLDSGQLTADLVAPMRYVLFAGEVFAIKQLRRLKELLPRDAGLYNLYGPTETNVCTAHKIPATIPPGRDRPFPIGATCPPLRARTVGQV